MPNGRHSLVVRVHDLRLFLLAMFLFCSIVTILQVQDSEFRSEMVAHVLLVGRRCQITVLL